MIKYLTSLKHAYSMNPFLIKQSVHEYESSVNSSINAKLGEALINFAEKKDQDLIIKVSSTRNEIYDPALQKVSSIDLIKSVDIGIIEENEDSEIKELKEIIKVQAQIIENLSKNKFGGNWKNGEIIHSYAKAEQGMLQTAAFIRYDIYLEEKDKRDNLLRLAIPEIEFSSHSCNSEQEKVHLTELLHEIKETLKFPWEREDYGSSKQKTIDILKMEIDKMEKGNSNGRSSI